MKIIAVIPARYASTRFPGKALAEIAGKPMIQHVFERSARARLVSHTIVATDDPRIADAVHRAGGEAIMTSTSHETGTDRLAEIAMNLDADIIVNVQGDEPLICPDMIDQAIQPFLEESDLQMGTLKTRIKSLHDFLSPNVVKVVTDNFGNALYFSRSPLPFFRDKWKDLKDYTAQTVYFAHLDNDEDLMTATYLRDTAEQAGLKTAPILMPDIGWDEQQWRFLDADNNPIETLFKLYPWEMMLAEEFSQYALDFMHKVQWIEPIWKMMFSNKGLLAILWEMYPNDPLLLPAYLDGPRDLKDFVRKPLLGREGANITLVKDGEKQQTYGQYGAEGWLYQAAAPIPCLDGNYPVIGSWIIADQGPAGMGLRESSTPVTTNTSRFVPHLFR